MRPLHEVNFVNLYFKKWPFKGKNASFLTKQSELLKNPKNPLTGVLWLFKVVLFGFSGWVFWVARSLHMNQNINLTQ